VLDKYCFSTEQELNFVETSLNVSSNFLRDPLDEEEKPRIDVEDNQTLVIVDVPYVYEEDRDIKYETIPWVLSYWKIILLPYAARKLFDSILQGQKSKRLFYFKKTRFTLQILYLIAKDFLKY